MRKSSRRKRRSNNEIGAVQVLEEAFHLLRSVDVKVYWLFYLGSVPFVVGLLYFSADMSRSGMARQNAAFAAGFMTILYFWMRFFQAKFCAGLWSTLGSGEQDEASGCVSVRSVAALFLLHSVQAPLLVMALFLVLPLGWVIAARESLSVLAFRGGKHRGVRELLSESLRHSGYQWAQNHGVLLVLGFVALFMWINVIGTVIMIPTFAKAIFGIDTVFTTSPLAAVLNSTFFLGSLLLTYLVVAPLVKAAYTIRCFHAGARRSGEDLLSRLSECRELRRRQLSAAAIGLMILVTALVGNIQAQQEQGGKLEPLVLNESITDTLEQKKYQWQFPRGEIPEESRTPQQSWLAARLQEVADSTRAAIEALGKMIEEWFEKFIENQSESAGGNDKENETFFKNLGSTMSLALVFIVVGVIVWIFVALYRKYRSDVPVEVEDDGVGGVVDLESEDIIASQLPEDEWMKLAREQMQGGDRRLAVRALFLASLAKLGEDRILKIARFKSNRDYRRELERRMRSNRKLITAFSRNVKQFERCWYGNHGLDDVAVNAFLANHEIIVKESGRRLTQVETVSGGVGG